MGFYRALFFLPVVTLPAAVAIVWRYLLNGDFGILNYLLSFVGIDGPSWVGDSRFALYSLVVVGVWSTIGYNIVILLSGLQTISPELYEASALDGAGPVRQFFSITVPMLSPSIFFVTVLSVIGSLQMFDLVYVMVGRTSPALQSTQTVIFLFYERAFVDNDRGYAAAIVFVLLLLVLAMTLLQFRLQRDGSTMASSPTRGDTALRSEPVPTTPAARPRRRHRVPDHGHGRRVRQRIRDGVPVLVGVPDLPQDARRVHQCPAGHLPQRVALEQLRAGLRGHPVRASSSSTPS